MEPTIKLLSYLQDLKQLLTDDFYQDVPIQSTIQSLAEIEQDLASEQLRVHILSVDLELAKSFQQLISSAPKLKDIYQFQTYQLQQFTATQSTELNSAFLILENPLDAADPTQLLRYPLSETPFLTVGRKPGCDVQIPDAYTTVSGQHLDIHYCPPDDRNLIPQWLVKNSDRCRHGTYINGEQLIDSHRLKSGDCLVLGDRHPSAQSPALRFEDAYLANQSSGIQQESERLHRWVNSPIVLVLLESQHQLLEIEQRVLDYKQLQPGIDVFCVHCFEQEFAVKQESGSSETTWVELSSLYQKLAAIEKRQMSAKKSQRAALVMLSEIWGVEQKLLEQQQINQCELEQLEQQQAQTKLKKAPDDLSTLIKRISEQKATLVETVDVALEQSKQDLVDDSLSNSILYRLSNAIDALEAHVTKQKNGTFLELKAEGYDCDVNDFIMQFCEQELLEWTTAEWRNARQHYGGGLEGLMRRTDDLLKSTVGSEDSSFTTYMLHEIELQEVFRVSLKKIPGRIGYQPTPAWSFFLKKIRSSVFQIMGSLFLLSFLGLSRGSLIKSVNKQISSSLFLSLLVLALLGWLIHKLYQSYRTDQELEIQKASEKIRQDLKAYYQKIVKNRFVEKLTRSLKLSFKVEIGRFETDVKTYVETVNNRQATQSGCADQVKLDIKTYKEKSRQLESKFRQMQKIKDRIQAICSKASPNRVD